jgi:hypothetical protein
MAEKLLSNEVTLSPDAAGDSAPDEAADPAGDEAANEAGDDAAEEALELAVVPLLHPVTMIKETATAARSDGRVFIGFSMFRSRIGAEPTTDPVRATFGFWPLHEGVLGRCQNATQTQSGIRMPHLDRPPARRVHPSPASL